MDVYYAFKKVFDSSIDKQGRELYNFNNFNELQKKKMRCENE